MENISTLQQQQQRLLDFRRWQMLARVAPVRMKFINRNERSGNATIRLEARKAGRGEGTDGASFVGCFPDVLPGSRRGEG
ncbi:ATPase [Anopheles sinensis]|uniref:ATPase n=1 Tax=Anopheles sinensis TaxID=74873 RepID=A0A084VYJ1_ANOSI|nr:ATPase [Anopheles sinensis]